MADLKKVFGRSKQAVVDAISSTLEEPLKSAQTAIIQRPVSEELYALEILRRSLPFVVKIDIETEEVTTTNASVIVYFKNGLTARIECYRKPEKTEELVNVALAGAHQCLSDLAFAALFNYAGKDRHVWRDSVSDDEKHPIIISSELNEDAPKFVNAVPDGAPGLRDVLLSVPGVACLPGENSTSNAQVKKRPKKVSFDSMDDPRVAALERGRITHDRVEKPRLDKTTAKRATNAMAELLRSVGIDGTEDETGKKR